MVAVGAARGEYTEMTCDAVLARIGDFLDRELRPGAHAAVREHLVRCRACARAFAFQARLLAGLRRRVRNVTPPAGLAQNIGNLLRKARISGR